MTKQTKRGDVFIADLDPTTGSEQGGSRPVLIVQADRGTKNAPTAIVLPITSQSKPALPTHTPLGGTGGLSDNSIALAEQIRTLDKSRLAHRIGSIGCSRMAEVDAAIKCALGLTNDALLASRNIKTLCHRCKQDYEDAGYTVRHVGGRSALKNTCDYCNTGIGFDYEVEGGRQ